MAKVGAFCERTCAPGQLAPRDQKLRKLRPIEGRVGESRHHAGCTMAMLAKVRRLARSRHRSPLDAELWPNCIASKSTPPRIGHTCMLALVEPAPATEQGDHVSGEAMHWPKVARPRAVEVLRPQRTEIGILKLLEKPRRLF